MNNNESPTIVGKVQPQAVEVECAVLGGLMLEKEAFPLVAGMLRPDTFYLTSHQRIYEAMLRLSQRQQPIDMLTVTDELAAMGCLALVGGAPYIAELTGKVSSAAHIAYHVKILNQKALARDLIAFASRIEKEAYDESADLDRLLASSTNDLNGILESQAAASGGVVTIADVACDIAGRIADNVAHPDQSKGDPTGFDRLDRLGGLVGGELWVIAAETGQGKTALAIDMSHASAVAGVPSAFFSLEMPILQIVSRYLAVISGVRSRDILQSPLDEISYGKVLTAIDTVSGVQFGNIYFPKVASPSLSNIIAEVRLMKQKYDIHGFVIDQLQLMRDDSVKYSGRTEELDAICRAVKCVCVELGLWCILISQLNRNVNSPEPTLSRLRGTAQIEQIADFVVLLYRPEEYKLPFPEPYANKDTHEAALVKIGKGRETGTSAFLVRWSPERSLFYDEADYKFADAGFALTGKLPSYDEDGNPLPFQ